MSRKRSEVLILPVGTRIDPGDEILELIPLGGGEERERWLEIPMGSRIGRPVAKGETIRRASGVPAEQGRRTPTEAEARRFQAQLRAQEREDADADEHEQRIGRALTVVYRREGFEVKDNHTPLTELLRRDEIGETALALERRDALGELLNYFFADGHHPGQVLRRVYAVAWSVDRRLMVNMTQKDMALMFGETRAAMSWRIKKIFSGYLKAWGAKGFKAPGQKTETAVRKYRAAQAGNTNRLGTGTKSTGTSRNNRSNGYGDNNGRAERRNGRH